MKYTGIPVSMSVSRITSYNVCYTKLLRPDDVIITIATDSAEMYRSRVEELRTQRGEYDMLQAVRDFEQCLT